MVNTVGKNISEVVKSYTAGFLDADGAIMAPVEHHQEKKFRIRVRIVVHISQRDEISLRWFQEQFGIGRVVFNRSSYVWIIKDQAHIRWLLQILQPYILVNQRQLLLAQKILDHPIIDPGDVIYVAQLADTLSSYNVKSKTPRYHYSLMVQEVFSRND